jgi:hypothetical protein
LTFKAAAKEITFGGRQFSLKLIQNGGPQVKIANGYPLSTPFGQGLIEPFYGAFIIRVKGDDGIDPYFNLHPLFLQPLNIFETFRGRSSIGLEKIPISLTQRNQTDPRSDEPWMTGEEFDESVRNPTLGQKGESNPPFQEYLHGGVGDTAGWV